MENKVFEYIKDRSETIFEKVKVYREYLHQNPELSYMEYETMEYVATQLEKIGLSVNRNVGKTGVTALISGVQHKSFDECIALRADLDALPIQEENDISFISKVNGVMHACGHDVHTAILLGAAEILFEMKELLPFPVKLIFQPGEEKNPGGATLMIADKVLDNPRVKRMYALHVFPEMNAGSVGFKSGIYMASCDEIHLTIIGKGGHGATPDQCIDPIVIGSSIVLQLQQVVSRICDPKIPCVLSFGHFEALGATNVIPSKAILKGTFRTMDEKWRIKALQLINDQIHSIAAMYGATVELEISQGYPYLENDPKITQAFENSARTFLGEQKVETLSIRLTSEDFAFYSHQVPVCFFRLGVRNEAKGIVYGVHHPKFNIDDVAMKTGVQMMCLAAIHSSNLIDEK